MNLSSGYNMNVTRFILQDEDSIQSSPDSNIKSIQVCRAGTFKDERYGKFTITRQMLSEMIENFNDKVRGIIPALDYKHESDDIAAGWFKKLYLKGDELWADVEMTPNGSRVLSDKEFGYVSAEFDTNYIDNETGKKHGCVLLGAGLTNRPVIKRMTPVITLSEKQEQKLSEKENAMELEEMKKKLAEYEAKCAEYEKKMSEMEEKMKGMIEKPIEEIKDEKPEVEIELANVKKELAEAKEKIQLAEKTSEFSKLLSEGKAVEAQRDAFIKGDMNEFISKAVPIKLSEQGSSAIPAEEGQMSSDEAEEKVLSEAKKLSEEKQISMKDAIAEVLKNNKKLAEKIR